MARKLSDLSPEEVTRASLLIQFLQVTKDGLVKPFDPTPVIKKLDALQRDSILSLEDATALKKCCPPVAQIQDAKDFKPYINAVLEQFADVMDLDVRHGTI